MKVNGSINPPRFTLETNPRRPNFRLVRFHENSIETERDWEYDEYCLEFPTSDTLEAEIEAHYGEYLKQAMEAEGASEAEYISVARNAALERIEGKCSAVIYAGVDVNGKHYSFTQTAQGNIKGMLIEAQNGKTVFLYCADNEPLITYTADEIKAIAQVMGEWISVNTVYYEQLKTWINRETDEVVLSTIHYGSQLPNDLTQEFTTKLASVGVDITKYASMLGVDK